MQMLGTQMRYLTQRQGVLSQNVANIDTPGYTARDLKPLDFKSMAAAAGQQLPMRATSGKHFTQGVGSNNGGYRAQEMRGFDVSPTDNNVSLDQEMAKISETGAQYQVSSNLYRKFTQLYRSALGQR